MKRDVKILRIFLGFLCILGLVSQVLSVTKEGLSLKSGMLIVISLLGLAGAVSLNLMLVLVVAALNGFEGIFSVFKAIQSGASIASSLGASFGVLFFFVLWVLLYRGVKKSRSV